MPETFYIESDEEIISAIGRLRTSREKENFFVFPKRALILQSIINLRLFQKEAQKMGKTIVIVTQDEIGRMLAEKSGIRTENYSDEFSQKANHLELVHQENSLPETESSHSSESIIPAKAEMIGSNTFFSKETLLSSEEPPLRTAAVSTPVVPPVQKLRIRNASPERTPSLNSMRQMPEDKRLEPRQTDIASPLKQTVSGPTQEMRTPSHPLTPTQIPQVNASPRPGLLPSQRPTSQIPNSSPQNLSQTEKPSLGTGQSSALKSFFAKKPDTPNQSSKQLSGTPSHKQPSQSNIKSPSKPEPKKPSPVVHNNAKKIFYVFGFLSVLLVGSVLGYLLFPSVTVKITPLTASEKMDAEITGVTNGADDQISTPVRLLEREVPITVTGTATDSSSSTTEKARGSLVIYNDYSAESQSLVATTRFETSDGKIFRLAKNAVVPGKTTTPGAIEVEVIADQPGESYNIDPTTFTIPGFKGSDKFDKFSGKSTKKMTGGGAGGSEVKVISKTDLDKAEAEARKQAEMAFLRDIDSSKVAGEVFLKESLEITPLETGTRPKEGVTASTFDYPRTYSVKAFLLQENNLKSKLELASQKEYNGVRVVPTNVAIEYAEITPNFADKSVRVKFYADIQKRADLDSEALKEKLLGKDTQGVEAFLGENPGVQKVELVYKPDWFPTSIPKNKDRVEVTIL